MRAEDLGFNKEFLEMVIGIREMYNHLQIEAEGKINKTFDEWVDENITAVDDNTFDGWSDREKYLFAFGATARIVQEQIEM